MRVALPDCSGKVRAQMTDAWSINAGGRVYGPYTLERMHAFAEEGRLAAYSLVTCDGAEWHEASTDAAFAKFFVTGGDAPAATAVTEPSPAPTSEDLANGVAHLTIAVDVKSQAKAKLERAILSLGPTYKLLSNVWIVSSDQPVAKVRNRLVRELGKRDSLFVVDSTHGKAAWFNFGADADTRIRRVWQKTA